MLTCNVVKDLLPNYIEGLVSEETAGEIEAHLAECAECRNMYEQMTTPLAAEEEQEEAEVDFLKKVRTKSKWRILKYSAICVFIAVLIVSFVSFRVIKPELAADNEAYYTITVTMTSAHHGYSDNMAIAISPPGHSGYIASLDIAVHTSNGHEPLLAAWDFFDGESGLLEGIIIKPQETLLYQEEPILSFTISDFSTLKEHVAEDFRVILRLPDRDIVFTLGDILAMSYE